MNCEDVLVVVMDGECFRKNRFSSFTEGQIVRE